MAKFNFYLGSAISSWLLAILVIAAELSGQFKEFLKLIFTHHWVGKGAIITLAFLAFGFLLKDKNSVGKFSDEKVSWYSMLVSLIVILAFFVIEYLK